MEVITSRTELSSRISEIKKQGLTLGFVPTMGALHEGHLSLVRASKDRDGFSMASIFVNPLQFNNPEDLEKYPRTEEEDLRMLEGAGCDLVFVPSTGEMYPEAVSTTFDFGELEQVMEGRHRPGHFNGVAIVVERLLQMFRPDRAYFGEKDYQQLMIIRKLVEITGMGIEIVPCEIVREADGLAMSSRNRRLSPEQRLNASFIFETLNRMRAQAGKLSPQQVKQEAFEALKENPWFEPEYVEIANAVTLQPAQSWDEPGGCRAFVAAFMGQVRLIDNISIS